MTKVTKIWQEPKEEKQLKPIEFKFFFNEKSKKIETYSVNPNIWDSITLLCPKYVAEMDLMWCMEGHGKRNRCLVLGFFNDGVVSND